MARHGVRTLLGLVNNTDTCTKFFDEVFLMRQAKTSRTAVDVALD